jgi:hypothetical protein
VRGRVGVHWSEERQFEGEQVTSCLHQQAHHFRDKPD